MFPRVVQLLRRIFTTVYDTDPTARAFLERGETQETQHARITVAVPTSQECRRFFGVHVYRHAIQPVFVRVENRHTAELRLSLLAIDPHYYTPLEAAGMNYFSTLKKLSAFGVAAWFFFPLLMLLPGKLWTAARANRRMDECFRDTSFSLRPIPPGGMAEGFVFATLDAGSKTVHVCLYSSGGAGTEDGPEGLSHAIVTPSGPLVDTTFTLEVPGIKVDYLKHDFAAVAASTDTITCEIADLTARLSAMPNATTNAKGLKHGDPVNLVVLGEFETLLSAFTSRWDECETITLETCWKTVKAFLFGAEYRYSPVSPLHLFGRSQDVALQRIRSSINERLHLRLWLTPLRFRDRPVWVGQISRDIGVRFTTQVWNLTTHRVDPDVDESRDYVVQDLLRAHRVDAIGYVDGVGSCDASHPKRNLTGDPYFTDGKRAVIALSNKRTTPQYIAWA